MIDNRVKIIYGDVAPGAKENFQPKTSEDEFGTINQLKQYNVSYFNYANPCELYSVVLDGKSVPVPNATDSVNVGLWSKNISDSRGIFADPIIITLSSNELYTSNGLTLTFDTNNNIYATNINIHWWRDSEGELTDLGEQMFVPDDAFYYCKQSVQNYNRVVITIYSINMPFNRLKLKAIDYGYGTIFEGKNLKNVQVNQQINPISTEIAINTASFIVKSDSNVEYSFQERQPISIYYNGFLKATTFVKKSKRTAINIWNVNCEDYVGILDGATYYGGMYNGADAYELLEDIFKTANVPYRINDNIKGVKLYGYIPITTCRDAAMQVVFAVQNIVDTCSSDIITVRELNDDITQTIPLNRIMQGQNFTDEEVVTGVEIIAHSYKKTSEELEVYNSEESGIGENIVVKFPEPLHSLTIVNGEFVLDDAGNQLKHTNYAIINANNGCVLKGKKYEHSQVSKRQNNPVVSSNVSENIIVIETATLISQHNIQNVLNKCYKWLINTRQTECKIAEGKHVQYGDRYKWGEKKWGTFKWGQKHADIVTYDAPIELGDMIAEETEYMGEITGRIIKQSYQLNGNIIVKDVVIR